MTLNDLELLSKTSTTQTSRGLSATVELLVVYTNG